MTSDKFLFSIITTITWGAPDGGAVVVVVGGLVVVVVGCATALIVRAVGRRTPALEKAPEAHSPVPIATTTTRMERNSRNVRRRDAGRRDAAWDPVGTHTTIAPTNAQRNRTGWLGSSTARRSPHLIGVVTNERAARGRGRSGIPPRGRPGADEPEHDRWPPSASRRG